MILSSVFAAFGNGCNKTPSFDTQTCALVAQVYVESSPILGDRDRFSRLVRDHRSEFSEGGSAIRCMQALGTALRNKALQNSGRFNGNPVQERFGSSMPEGLGHLPGQVDASLRGLGAEHLTMAEELLWLASVLPAAMRGDSTLIRTTATETRRMMQAMVPTFQLIAQSDPWLAQQLLQVLREMKRVLVQEVFALAQQLGK